MTLAGLYEVLTRRYGALEENDLPDFADVDGGRRPWRCGGVIN
jgi:excinuclease UvrABC nuclease subunit